ncbi:MBL fold metallo-hydrolase [Tissierella sp.]|uniref:MBL fold metallo-hydrolase n=1 Tax=Tissierella sp. TaxID=41274 RepID=UPI0030345730
MKCLFQIANSELYVFSFQPIDSKMYIIISKDRAIIIDPCVDENAMKLLMDRAVKDIIILPTHEHYDHISGINWLKNSLNCKVIAIEECAKNLSNPKRNASAHFSALFLFSLEEVKEEIEKKNIKPYICNADEIFNEQKSFNWEGHKIDIVKTPGHSKGSVCIRVNDEYVFTGDSLIKGIPTITRLPGGSKKEFQEITLPFLKSLSPTVIIFPGHGETGYMKEFEL